MVKKLFPYVKMAKVHRGVPIHLDIMSHHIIILPIPVSILEHKGLIYLVKCIFFSSFELPKCTCTPD